MNAKLIFLGVLAVGGIAVFSSGYEVERADTAVETVSVKGDTALVSKPGAAKGLKTQEKELGAVTLEVTPENLEPGNQAIFEVVLNTHSVELDYDFTEVFSLTDDTGRSYAAQQWTGGNSGHHLSGQILFEPLGEDAEFVTLTAKGIDNQSAVFEWEILLIQ